METQQKSWFGRNWLWVLPVGGCLTVILLLVLGVGAAYFGVTKLIDESPYEYALEIAKNDPDVQLALGEPIETNGIFQGNISFDNDGGDADLKIPIKGPSSQGTIIVLAERINNEWTYEKLYVLIDATNEEINLIDKTLEGI